MAPITIPKELIKEKELVLIPRREYEALLKLRKIMEFTPTSAQKKAIRKAEGNLKRGRTLSYNELVKKLGVTD